MTVIVDPLFVAKAKESEALSVGRRNGHRWCHMVSDQGPDAPELHAMAERIGMRREWFQGDHYDLTPPRRAMAVALGAKEGTGRDVARALRNGRAAALVAKVAARARCETCNGRIGVFIAGGCVCAALAPFPTEPEPFEHFWMTPAQVRERWPHLTGDYSSCLWCGHVKRRDGLNTPCRGIVRITLR